jgi:Acetyltransferase (GNAT) domain
LRGDWLVGFLSGKAEAELLVDGGAAVAADEFFRSAEFMAAEGVTHTLRIGFDGSEALAPLLVREIEGGGTDGASPYGYPGVGAPPGTRLDPAEVDWSLTGLVSIFLRHRLGEPALSGTSARNEVQIADPALPRKSRPSDRQQIRRNAERGYEVRSTPGPRASDADRAGFLAAYEETMRRAAAAERYFFGPDYFATILAFPSSWLFCAIEPGGGVAAASIVTRSDAMLHYYLSGTADRFISDSPMKNLVAAIVDFAESERLPLNLGGGIAPGDRLEEFKRGFANRSERFHTSEIVCDPGAYERLTGDRQAGDFFPAYRS